MTVHITLSCSVPGKKKQSATSSKPKRVVTQKALGHRKVQNHSECWSGVFFQDLFLTPTYFILYSLQIWKLIKRNAQKVGGREQEPPKTHTHTHIVMVCFLFSSHTEIQGNALNILLECVWLVLLELYYMLYSTIYYYMLYITIYFIFITLLCGKWEH